MRNKNCSKSLIQLIITAFMILIVGVMIGSLNIGQVNERIANLKTEDKEVIEISDTIETEEIIAAYTPRRVEASEEVISRYNRARKYEQYISVDEVTISKNMDLTQRCNISREDFIDLIAGVRADTSGFFEENELMKGKTPEWFRNQFVE